MKVHEIFKEVDPATAASVFQFLRDEHRDVYTMSLSSLANNRKLRPVFIQRKPATAQIEWLVKNVKLRASDEIGEHILQLWLMKAHQQMLTDFLDGMEIEHDGEGAAEDIPDELDATKLQSTVTQLLKDHDPEVVKVYLRIFQTQRPGGWDELNALFNSMPELQFGASAAPAPAEEPSAPAEEPETPADAVEAAGDEEE